MLHEFKLRHNASETAANIMGRHGEISIQVIREQRCFHKFRGVYQSLEDEKGRGWVYSLDNEKLQGIVSKLLNKIHDNVPKKCLRHLLSAMEQHYNSFIYRVLEKCLKHTLAFCREFCLAMQLFIVKTAYPSSAFFIFKALIYCTLQNFWKYLCTVRSLVHPSPRALLILAQVSEALCLSLKSCNVSKRKSCFSCVYN